MNIDDILLLVPEKYQGIQYVFFFIGLAKLFNVSCGISGGVLLTSNKYRYDLYINLLLIGLTLFTNMIFIPIYGIEGAALATAISIVIHNLVKWYLLKKWFGFQPFTYRFLLGVIISLITLFITSLISFDFEMLIVRIILKSIFILFSYSLMIISLRVSPEINKFVFKYL